jgi:hypothetical protein
VLQFLRPVPRRAIGVAAHQDDPVPQFRPAPHNGDEEGVARHERHPDIQEDRVKPVVREQLVGGIAAAGGHRVVPEMAQRALQGAAHCGFVVHD